MMNGSTILSLLRQNKDVLRTEFGVKDIGLFGSYAMGDFTDTSDIDILVELERPIGWKYFDLEKFLANLFNKKIDMVTKNALKADMKPTVLRQVLYA